MLFGEAQSKCDHVAGVPLLPEVAEKLHLLFLAKGALATTAIEGNTLTESQVLEQLEGKLNLPPSQEYLKREVQNIIDACNTLQTPVINGAWDVLSVDSIKRINRMVLKGLEVGEDVVPGEIRSHSVTVGNYRGAPAEDCEYLLERLCEMLNSFVDENYSQKVIGLIKAVFAHLYLAWIHAFGDGNGRTARLLEFVILLSHGVATPAAHLLSNHYNATRTEYYRQLDQASKTRDPLPFLEYAIQGFIDQLKQQLKTIRQYQLDLTWQRYIYDVFKDKTSDTDKRRRELLLNLSEQATPIYVSTVNELTPRIAKAYAGLTSRTLDRDLKLLEDEGLIEIEHGVVKVNKEMIESFLPDTKGALIPQTIQSRK
jgi:Fic family protein